MAKPKTRKDSKGRALRVGEIQRKDSVYCYSFTDPLGRRKRIYAPTLTELRKKEEDLLRDQLDGLDVYVAGSADVNFLFDRYISTKSELRPTTKSNYIYMYDKFVRDTFGKKKIKDVHFSDILQFYFILLTEKNIAINTLETIHTILHPSFNLAVRDNIIRNNPSDGVMADLKKKWAGKKAGVRHALSAEQQKAFLEYCRKSPYRRWAPLFTVMFGTGCRVGEAVGLRWEDVDMEKRVISINHAVVYYTVTEGKGRNEKRVTKIQVSLPKTEAGIRYIPMMQQVYDAFIEEKEFQHVLRQYCDEEVDGMSGFIFGNRYGNVHNPAGINRAIKRIYESYNMEEVVKAKRENREPLLIPHFSCHHMRHTFCSRLCENDVNIKVVQEIMGHSTIDTTLDIYAEITGNKKAEVMAQLSESLDVF